MASSREYLDYILEQLSGLDGVSCRAMMGEYILYLNGKIVGGIYDDRLMLKPVSSARKLMPDAASEAPYPGGKAMLVVDNVDNRSFLKELFTAVYNELPERRK